MAKKSAASKGYRKTVKKKPFLTKKEIILLVAIIVAIIAAVVLFNLFFGSGYLKAEDLQENDVASVVNSDLRSRYVKVAEAHDLDGFTRTDPDRKVNATSSFSYTPDEDTDNISLITVGGTYFDAAQYVDSSIRSASGVSTQRYDITAQGCDAYAFGYTYDYYLPAEGEKAEDSGDGEAPESNVFCQNLNLFVQVEPGRTVTFHIYRTGEDDSFYLPDDEIVDYILGYANQAFTVYVEPED